MFYLVNRCKNPSYNLALEEYLFKNFGQESCLILWQNEKSVIIGKHQNAQEEINKEMIRENQIPVVRRITGGGAVFHDLGNLNYSFITDWTEEKDLLYDRFLLPVIRGLASLSVQAQRQGRNDIAVQGHKISGNAQAIHKNRILHHGTLLIASDLSMLSQVLNPAKKKYESKGVPSVRSRVSNLAELYPGLTVEQVSTSLIHEFSAGEKMEEIILSESDIRSIQDLAKNKYQTWEWNYGKSPDFHYRNEINTFNGTVVLQANIGLEGKVQSCKIQGDFLSRLPACDLEKAFTGRRFTREAWAEVLASVHLYYYFGDIQKSDLVQLVD